MRPGKNLSGRASYERNDFIEEERLGRTWEGVVAKRVGWGLESGVSRHQNDASVGIAFHEMMQERQASDVWQLRIEKDDVNAAFE